MAAINPPQTVLNGLVLCGVPTNIIWNGANQAQRIATDVFNNDFTSCMDKSFAQLDDDWKTYSAFTVANGQIRVNPQVKNNVRAFIQWCRDEIRMGRDPADAVFPVAEAANLIRRYNTHKQWLDRAPDKAKNAKPRQFVETMRWLDWKDLFINFLRTQPGRNGIPLSYIICPNDNAIVRVNTQFIDDYVDQAPLDGAEFAADSEEVHTFITGFISDNPVAEQKIQPILHDRNGREDFKMLCEYYEGVGVNATAIVRAEEDIASLFYSGEKKPHMWWQEFETKLTNAFAIIDKESGRQVYSNASKLRLLNKKVKADFLEQSKVAIELELSRIPMTMTYNLALSIYRNAVNRKFPPETQQKRTRRVQEVGTDNGNRQQRRRQNNGHGRGNGRGGGRFHNNGGRGRGRGRGGRGGYRNNDTTASETGWADAWFIQCTDGSRLEVHPRYRFSREDWNKIPHHIRDELIARKRQMQQRSVSQASSFGSYNPSLPPHTHNPPPTRPHGQPPQFIGQASIHNNDRSVMPPPPRGRQPFREPDSRTMMSEITTDRHIDDNSSFQGSIMGGRNEQASMRSRQNGRWIGKVCTSVRHVGSANTRGIEPDANTLGNNEADTNADTCCLGTNFIPIAFTNRTADVYPYDSDYSPALNVPIVSGATAYDHSDGTTYILVFHESLYYGTKLGHSLINPNQVRHCGVGFWDNPYDYDRDLCIEPSEGPTIPLRYTGTKLIFSTRVPTNEELASCTHIDMTSSSPWEPSSVTLGECNSTSYHTQRQIFSVSTGIHHLSHNPFCHSTIENHEYCDPTSDESILHSIEPSLVDFNGRMISAVSGRTISSELDTMPEYLPARRTFSDRQRHRKLSAQSLSELWNIGLQRAKDTIKATTQHMIRSAILPIGRRYRSDRMYGIKRLQGKFATDTFYSPTRSVHGNTCAQVFSHKNGFSVCYPMTAANGESIGSAFGDFIHDYGAPSHITFDGAQVQVGRKTKFQHLLRKHHIDHHVSSPRRPNENPGESAIRLIKLRTYRYAHRRQVPRRYWDFLLIWICETGNLTVSSSKYAEGRTPLEIITGITPDISEYLDFGFYDWVTYRTNAGLGPLSIGRWLGVSHKVGQLMSYWILTKSGKIISCVTVQRVTTSEEATDEYKELMQSFTQAIDKIKDAPSADISHRIQNIPDWNRLSLDENDPEFMAEFQRVVSDESIPEADADKPLDSTEAFDPYINMEIGLPCGDNFDLQHARVKRRAINEDGIPIGKPSNNPITDTRKYEVEFLDGTTEVLAANVIAENLFAQIDEEGHRQLLMSEIIDHRKSDQALPEQDAYYYTTSGIRRRKRTTHGWDLCVEWKDGSSTWVALKDMKNSYPLEVADYAINNHIDHEPAFAWWVPYTVKKRRAIISKVKSKYWQRTHKYGIRIPKSVNEALSIDKENGDNVWRDSIKEEMAKIRDAFELYEDNPKKLVGYQRITTHFIFDIKLGENFRRKSRLVADGHKTKPPRSVTYSSVVSRDSVRICLLLAALNDLDIQAADIENAYLTAPCREKCWTYGGREFGSDAGKPFIIRRALYGLKSSGAAFREHLAQRLDDIGFTSTIADPDVWLHPATKPDGEKYYEYILVYVDDLLCISHDPFRPMKQIKELLAFKKDKIAPPEFYLGARLEKKNLNGRDMWTMTSRDYVKAAIENIEKQLHKSNKKLPSKAYTPMSQDYSPETDSSPELDSEHVTKYQEAIGILRWAIEIGRVDIMTEVSMLSSYQASPREGHLEQVYHIFAYLKLKPKLTLYFDPRLPNIDPSWSQGDNAQIFKETYRDAKEELPPKHMMPQPRGRCISMTAFVDASHAANKVTRRSHTGFIIFINRAPIIYYSKRQNTVESSAFSSEFIAMKTCVEHITALRYKLRMFRVPVDESAKVLCDNESVVKNSSRLDSVLNKKHCSLAYHATRWAVAASIISIGWIPTDLNLADAMTKRLTAIKRESLFGSWTY